MFLAKFKCKELKELMKRILFERTGCTIPVGGSKGHVSCFPCPFIGLASKWKGHLPLRGSVSKNSQWKLQLHWKHWSTREIFYKTRWKKSLFVKSVTFVEIREKKYTTYHYVNFFKNVSLNVAEFSTFQKEKIYLRT